MALVGYDSDDLGNMFAGESDEDEADDAPVPAAATDELPTVAEEWCRAKELVQSGLASFPIDARLLVTLELALREGLVGGHWSSLRRSMSEDHDVVLHTPSASGEVQLRWGCTKSGVTADNMCYVWAEDEPTLGLFQPLADALIAELAPTTPHPLMLYAASFIVHAPPGTSERSAIPHNDWDLNLPRGASFTALTPLYPLDATIGGVEYWPLPFDRFAAPGVRKYAHGEAVVFDGRVQHRTQPYHAEAAAFPAVGGAPLRVLVQMSFAARDERLWGDVQASLERQSTGYFRSPGGPCEKQLEAAAALPVSVPPTGAGGTNSGFPTVK